MASNAQFRSDFAKLLKQAGNKVEMVVRETALVLQTSMVSMSPVDTGRFKGNWQAGIESVNTDTSASDDKSGEGPINRTVEVLKGWKVGQTIYLTNSLPYAIRLEYYGWSKKAPDGFVRLTIQNYKAAVAKAVENVK